MSDDVNRMLRSIGVDEFPYREFKETNEVCFYFPLTEAVGLTAAAKLKYDYSFGRAGRRTSSSNVDTATEVDVDADQLSSLAPLPEEVDNRTASVKDFLASLRGSRR